MQQGVREEVIEAAVGVQRSHVQAILERLQVRGACVRFDPLNATWVITNLCISQSFVRERLNTNLCWYQMQVEGSIYRAQDGAYYPL